MGLGITFVAVMDVLPHLRDGALVRLMPDWYADIGPISLYYAGHRQLPAKTRVFVDYVMAEFKRQNLAALFDASGAAETKARKGLMGHPKPANVGSLKPGPKRRGTGRLTPG